MDKNTFAKDFFLELMKDSQHLRASYQAERERWLSSLQLEGREETLFEFEMLLRGLDRYFNPHQISGGDQDLMSRDFVGHVAIVRDALNRVVHLSRLMIAPTAESGFLFRQYLEGQVADDRARSRLVADLLEQRSPEESLFLLRSGFTSIRGIVDAILRLEAANYPLFADLGTIIGRELVQNKYFRPAASFEFRPEYDRIGSVKVLDLMRKVEPERLRRALAVGFLALFRLLRYLRFVPAPPTPAPRRTILIIALARGEAFGLASFLQTDLIGRIAAPTPDLAAKITSAAQRLKDALDAARALFANDPPVSRESVEEARLALSRACKEAIGDLSGVLDPNLNTKELFENPGARRETSMRLRRDLWIFRNLVERARDGLANASLGGPAAGDASRAVQYLKDFASYFRDVSYQLLRYGDQDPFDRFLDVVNSISGGFAASPPRLKRLVDDLTTFEKLLARTLTSVEHRRDLVGVAFNEAEAQEAMQKYMVA